MKKFTFRLSISIVALAVLTLASGCVRIQDPNSNKGPAGLSEVTTASSVTPDNRPLSASTVFLATTPEIFVTVKVSKAATVGARWVYVKDNSGKLVNQLLGEDSKTSTGNAYLSFSKRASSGSWASGQYSVSLLVNGNEVTSAGFSVNPVQQTDVPAPTIQYFKAVPEAISTGQAVTLSWSTSGAAQVEISTIGAVAATGNITVVPIINSEYQLKATNPAGTTSMKVNIQVTSFSTDKPELVITDFHAKGDKAYFKIKNIGGVNAKQSTTFLYVEGVKRASSLVDILAVGEEREQFFPNYVWTYGDARSYKLPVRVCADGLNVIGEYDDNNNCLVVDW